MVVRNIISTRFNSFEKVGKSFELQYFFNTFTLKYYYMKKLILFLFVSLFSLSLIAQVRTIKPRKPIQGDTWCNYVIKMVKGQCHNHLGDTICIYCNPKNDPNKSCPPRLVVSPMKGCVLTLSSLDPDKRCRNCIGKPGSTYQ